jgi:hypothetical protein
MLGYANPLDDHPHGILDVYAESPVAFRTCRAPQAQNRRRSA